MTGWMPPPRPTWVERLNAHARVLGDPAHLVSLDSDELLATARTMTGLDDFGDGDGWREHYEILMDSLRTESRLTLVGTILARHDLLNALRNRLLLTDRWNRRPEILAGPVEKPVFIVGSARTGTTLLHELFAADPANRTPATWELYHPVQALEGDALREPTDRVVRALHSIQPEWGTIHPTAGDLPNECVFIALPTFLGDYWSGSHVAPTYERHLLTSPQDGVYRFHRRFLQTLQERLASRRWVLKSPTHLGRLATLFAEYPDATIIQTHRDPLRTIPSLVSFMGTMKWMRCEEVDLTGMPQLIAAGTAAMHEAQIAARSRGDLPEASFIDVRYAELVADPLGVMSALYERLGWELTSAARDGMLDRLNAPPREGEGTHGYSLEALGLDPARERERFAAYQEHFGVPNEP